MLGQKVSRLGMSTHKQKAEAVVQLEPPKNIPTLQTFLGMMTYFSNYIPFYAWIAAPLFKLLKKDKPWEWTQLEQEAFRRMQTSASLSTCYGIPDSRQTIPHILRRMRLWSGRHPSASSAYQDR